MDHDVEVGAPSSVASPVAHIESSSAGNHGNGCEPEEGTTPTHARRWPRFAMDIPIQLQVTTQGPTKVLACAGQGTDISYGGLAVTANLDLPVGAQIGLELTPPCCNRPLIFRCVVRNRDENCYGVQFIIENDQDYRNAAELQAGLAAMNARPT